VTTAAGHERFILLGVPDVNGRSAGRRSGPDAFEAALARGTVMTDLILGLDPVDAPITDFERFGIRTGAADLVVTPDPRRPATCRGVPAGRCASGRRAGPTARRASSRRARSTGRPGGRRRSGYDVMAAIEYEIRIWDDDDRPTSSGISYSVNEIGRYERFLDELVPALDGLGIELSAVHTEAGPGSSSSTSARAGARGRRRRDLTKFAVKQVAAAIGLRASFLAKTVPARRDRADTRTCRGGGRPERVRVRRRERADAAGVPRAVAGVLEHLPQRRCCSTRRSTRTNASSRMVRSDQRDVGLREPIVRGQAIRSERPELWRFECRRPGADANPYLVLAAIAASAADGVRRGAGPPSPIEGDAYARTDLPELPGSLESAIRAFESDDVLRAALGKGFSDYFATTRAWELKAWRDTVTDWERHRYDRAV
jgi:glutamine synthetase